MQTQRVQLDARPRTIIGKKVRFLRREGWTPANMFGRGRTSVSIQLRTRDVEQNVAVLDEPVRRQEVLESPTEVARAVPIRSELELELGFVGRVLNDQAPRIPVARRARFAPINGPFSSARARA